jgi:hypothetical protein
MQNIFILILFFFSACDENPTNPSEGTPSNPILFMLEDLNMSSLTYGQLVGPDTWEGEIRLFYFSEDET